MVRGGDLRRHRPHPGRRLDQRGTRVDLEHVGASPVGQEVKVTAWASYVDGRLHRFTVAARNVPADGTEGKLVGTGEMTRVVVDRERFLSRL